MKVLLVYATLSGSTMTVAEIIASILRGKGHDVTTVTADAATPDMVRAHDAVVIGSPSWEDQGKDGQPLPEVTAFLGNLTPTDVAGKKIALFGLGDTSYPHFCGAVDIMEARIQALGSAPNVESLLIDRFYSSPDNEPKTRAWAETLAASV